MRRALFLLFTAFALAATSIPLFAQKFQPKSIQFTGDPEYTDQELMAAAGLKKGVVLTGAEMNEHSKALMDSGVFDNLTYKFDGQDLIFSLIPAEHLYAVKFQNLPLEPGPALDASLHQNLPLYHGKVPAEGTLLDQVRLALEQMLAGKGIQATITATPTGQSGTRKVNGVTFAITDPPVRASVSKIDGASDADLGKVQELVARASAIPYDTESSVTNLSHAVENYYQDRGYADVKVAAPRNGDPLMDSGAIVVPFDLHIDQGPIYKLGAIHVPDGTPVTQAEIDKTLAPRPDGPPNGVRVRSIWGLIAGRYRSKGYLDCKVEPHPQFDTQNLIVNYTADITPGPVYHLAFVKFDNVSDQLRALLLKDWQMLPGDPFDPTYVSTFIQKASQTDPALARTLAGIKTKFDVNADPESHEVTVIIRLER